jgi:YVTN family beta-propeller protein
MLIRNQKSVLAHLLNYLLLVAITAAPCLARDSGHLYVTNESLNTIDVIRASDHVRIASIPTITTPFGMALTHDGKRLYVSSYDSKTLSTFDTETNTLISTLKFGSELREVALTPDERFLYIPDYYENVVHVVSTGDNTLVADIPVGVNPHMVAFGGEGRYAYVSNEWDAYVSVIDTQTKTVAYTIPVGQTPTELAVSPDTQTIYVAAFSVAAIAVISVKSQSVIDTIPLPSDPYAVAVSPDGKFLYVTAAFPTAGYAISLADKSIIGTFPTGSGSRNIIVTPDGNTLYETNFDSKDYYAIDAHTLQLKYTKSLGGPDGIAFSNSARPIIEKYRFETVDYPGASETAVAQTNDEGTAVGWYLDQNGASHGFFYRHGRFTGYDVPGSPNTKLLGINSEGEVVGLYTNTQGYINGFRLRHGIRTDVYVQFQSTGNVYTVPTNEVDAIDDDGNLAGVYWNFVESANSAFLLDGSTTVSFDYPGAVYTGANGIARGTVSGWFEDLNNLAHAFFWRDGSFAQFDFPGAGSAPDGTIGYTFGYKINSRLDSVGLWGTPFSYTHGYVHKERTGKNISFDFPEAVATWNYGISDGGRITGSYQLNNVIHGFVATAREMEE